MTEKLLAGLVAAVAVAPLCAVCVLGPAVIASVIVGMAGWFGGFDGFAVAGLVLAAGIALFYIVLRRRADHAEHSAAGDTNQ